MNYTVVSFNVNGIRSNVDKIRSICSQADIIFLQELLLLPVDINVINQIHEDYVGVGVTDMICTENVLRGRPVGGSAVIWRKCLADLVKPWIPKDFGEAVGVQVGSHQDSIFVLGLYFPPDYGTHEDLVAYEDRLQCLSLILQDCPSSNVICVGDFNADPRRQTRFWESLKAFAESEQLSIEDVRLLPIDSFTYLSPAHDTVSWLDHVLISEPCQRLITGLQIWYTLNESDHFPIKFDLRGVTHLTTPPLPQAVATSLQSVCWEKASPDQRRSYHSRSEFVAKQLLNRNLCQVRACSLTDHKSDIDRFCQELETGLCRAARDSLGVRNRQGSKRKLLPGWDSLAKSAHSVARSAFLEWKSAGCPKSGLLRDAMADTRKQFKACVRKCKQLEKSLLADKLADSLLSKNPSEFWGHVKSLSAPPASVATVGGASGDDAIAKVWCTHFSRLLGAEDTEPPQEIHSPSGASFNFSADLCQRACKSLNSAASPGLSQLSVSSFTKASPLVFSAIAALFNSMLAHSYMPHEISDSVMVPLPKAKLADPTDMDSYRGIAITSTISKIMEVSLENGLKELLHTSAHQFAFKQYHGTLEAVFLLSETTREYTTNGSPVYACFLDLRKAFDSVDHSKLLDCLSRRGLPSEVIALFRAWFRSQRMCVRWASAISDWFVVRRGVRQGGCLSPTLFNVYLDSVLEAVRSTNIGCALNGHRLNVLAYADDLVLLAPSLPGLQSLVDLSHGLLCGLGLQVNTLKTECLTFIPTAGAHSNRFCPPVKRIVLGSTALPWVASFKYLGVMVTSSGEPGQDLTRARRNFLGSANTVLRRFGSCSLPVQARLYGAFCYSFYGAELWHNCKTSDLNALGVAIHSASKRLLGRNPYNSTRLASLELNVLPLPQLLVTKRLSLLRRLLLNPNPLIRGAVHGSRWCSSPYLHGSASLIEKWGLVNLNFLNCSFSDLQEMFLWEILRSLLVDPPYMGHC